MVYEGLDRGFYLYRPRSMVCYYGAHYQAFVLLPNAGGWALFDDASVTLVGDGSWRAVREKCRLGRIQPSVVFFEATFAAGTVPAPPRDHAHLAASGELPRPRSTSQPQPLAFPPPSASAAAISIAPVGRWAAGGPGPATNGHPAGSQPTSSAPPAATAKGVRPAHSLPLAVPRPQAAQQTLLRPAGSAPAVPEAPPFIAEGTPVRLWSELHRPEQPRPHPHGATAGSGPFLYDDGTHQPRPVRAPSSAAEQPRTQLHCPPEQYQQHQQYESALFRPLTPSGDGAGGPWGHANGVGATSGVMHQQPQGFHSAPLNDHHRRQGHLRGGFSADIEHAARQGQPWQHQQQQQPGGNAWSSQPFPAGGGQVTATPQGAWMVPRQEDLEAVLALPPVSGSTDLGFTVANAGPASVADEQWRPATSSSSATGDGSGMARPPGLPGPRPFEHADPLARPPPLTAPWPQQPPAADGHSSASQLPPWRS